jgi:hypothetical protein
MLIKSGVRMPWEKDRATFFTGNKNLFTKGDDEKAYDNLLSFGKGGRDSEAYQNYQRSIDILRQFPESIRDQLNGSNEINTVINNSMTDETGQKLVNALLALADKMGIEIRFED